MSSEPTSGLDGTLGCPHIEQCPGCPLGRLPYADGLSLKASRLGEALGRYPELALHGCVVLGAAPPQSQYRLRAKLVTDASGRLGLFAAGSHDVVDIPGCRVQAPAVLAAAAALRALLPLELVLRGVDLRLSDRGVLACLIVEGSPDRGTLEQVRRRVLEHVPNLSGLALNVARPGSVQLLGPELEVLSGPPAEPHHFATDAPWHYASHGAFTQVHAGQTARLHARIESLAHGTLGGLEGQRVLELYAGSGALALRLAARGARVTAVEAFAPALELVERAARGQALAVDTWAGDAGAFLREQGVMAEGARARARAVASEADPIAAVLVNPPRRGLAASVRAALAAARPRAISYVSCDPDTLARDPRHFAWLGFGVATLEAFDMIPWSDAVESLAWLVPRPPPAPSVLFEDATSVVLDKLSFEPVTAEPGQGSSLLERARQALGEPQLTPVHRLELGTSGVCWFARRPEHVPALAQELEQGQKTYIALARGITHEKGKISRPLLDAGQSRPALTRYRRRAVVGGHSLLELHPAHGPKHQLRRHLAAIGHAVVGDVRYGQAATNRHFEHRYGLERPFLHCASLRLQREQGPLEIAAPLAGDLATVLARLDNARSPEGW